MENNQDAAGYSNQVVAMDPALEIEIAALSGQKVLNEALKQGDSDIQKFYANTTIFLTGGTGFFGKHLIEKLFRSCKITKMYLLIRSKKEKTVKERLEEMLEDPVFCSLKMYQPDFSSRLVCVEGDASEIRLGLSEQNWEMLANEVEIIFHCAATTRFDEKLRIATKINIQGTTEALLLARATRHLKSYIHVSTAYSQATVERIGREVQESFYPTPIAPETLIRLVDELDERRLDAITPELIKNWPNTYTFCKAVAEEAVRTMSKGLPISIVRPGILAATYREPTPGWLDKNTVYGATGLFLGLGLGILHVLVSDEKVKVGIVPCDYATNAVIVAGKETFFKQSKGGNDTSIYNVAGVARNSLTWKKLSQTLQHDCFRIATPKALYYTFGFETKHWSLYYIASTFLHVIPAYLLDGLCFILGRERMFVKLSNKVHKMMKSLSYFCSKEWIFVDNNTAKLYENLTKKDQLIFNFDITDINWTEYILIWGVGVRKYIIKDGLKSTDKALRKQFWFRLLHYFLSCVFCYILLQVILIFYNDCRSFFSMVFNLSR